MWRHNFFKFPKLFIVRFSLYAKLLNPISGCCCCCFFFFQNNFSRLSLYSISIVRLAFSFWIIDLCRITLQWVNIKKWGLGWTIWYKSLYFVHPSLELVHLFTGMQERSIRYWKVVIATLETYKICVPNNHINKQCPKRDKTISDTRNSNQTNVGCARYMNFCLPKVESIPNTQETRIFFSPVEELWRDFSPNELKKFKPLFSLFFLCLFRLFIFEQRNWYMGADKIFVFFR